LSDTVVAHPMGRGRGIMTPYVATRKDVDASANHSTVGGPDDRLPAVTVTVNQL